MGFTLNAIEKWYLTQRGKTMLTQLLNWSNGRKTYIVALAWLVYKLAVGHGWIQPNQDMENSLLAGGALALRDAIAKLTK